MIQVKASVSFKAWALIAIAAALLFTAIGMRDRWSAWFARSTPGSDDTPAAAPITEPKVLKLGPEARKNLGLIVKPAKSQTYWRTIQIPGVISERPGMSDRGVTSPVVGIVTEIHAYPGDKVQSGTKLFTLRPYSEYLQDTQAELFKANREWQLIDEQRAAAAVALIRDELLSAMPRSGTAQD